MVYQTPAGIVKITRTENGIVEACFIDTHTAVSEVSVDGLSIVLAGTEFQRKVWQATLHIPIGTTVTYQELAENIGSPKAYRAVARALSQNRIAYFIPCHRVIQKSGKLGGYKWGIERKRALLQAEAINK